MLKWFFLRNTGLSVGVAIGLCASLLVVLSFLLIGLPFGWWKAGLVLGIFFGFVTFPLVYNYGLVKVKPKERALLLWFGNRPAPTRTHAFEIPNGDYWILKFAISLEPHSMEQRVLKLPKLDVDTRGEIKVPTGVEIYFTPKEGELYWYGLVNDVKAALTPAAHTMARAFAVAMPTVDELVENAINLSNAITDYLNKRSDGELNNVEVVDKKARFTKVGMKQPWGIDIQNVELPDFDIPKNIGAAAEQVIVNQKLTEAADIKVRKVQEVARGWGPGVDKTAALAAAFNAVDPSAPNPFEVRHHSFSPELVAALGGVVGQVVNRRDDHGRRPSSARRGNRE